MFSSCLSAVMTCQLLMAQVDQAPLDLQRRPPDWSSPREGPTSLVPTAPADTIEVINKTLGISSGIRQAQSIRVQPGPTEGYGHGYFIGQRHSMMRGDDTRRIAEVLISEGLQPSTGKPRQFVISYDNLNPNFLGLVADSPYIFGYKIPDPANPTYPEITSAQTPLDFLRQRQATVIPKTMLASESVGSLPIAGNTQGYITKVERFERQDPISKRKDLVCEMEMQIDPSATNGTFAPNRLEAKDGPSCKQLENLKAFAQPVSIAFAQQTSPTNAYYVKSVQILEPTEAPKFSNKDLSYIMDFLTKNEDFRKSILKR